jgi:hypothetical protein
MFQFQGGISDTDKEYLFGASEAAAYRGERKRPLQYPDI